MELTPHCALSAAADSIETAAAFLYFFRLHTKAPPHSISPLPTKKAERKVYLKVSVKKNLAIHLRRST